MVPCLVLMLVSIYGVFSQTNEDSASIQFIGPNAPPVSLEEAEELQANANTWIQIHQDGFILRKSESEGEGFRPMQSFAKDGSPTKKQLFHYSPDEQTSVTIGFKEDINKDMSAADLQAHLNFIALNKLPVQDFNPPSYWTVYPSTPLSSFSEGVTIEKFDGIKVKVDIKTKAFAMFGTRNDIRLAADQEQPAGTFFMVRQQFPMEISLDVPIQL